MRTTFAMAACAAVTLLSGCASTEFPDTGPNAAWYERTDPQAFLRHEQRRRGPAMFIGLFDHDFHHIIIPGVPRHDPLVSEDQACSVGWYTKTGSAEERRYTQAVLNFARRYNPLMLALLKQHPEYRVGYHPATTTSR